MSQSCSGEDKIGQNCVIPACKLRRQRHGKAAKDWLGTDSGASVLSLPKLPISQLTRGSRRK